MELFRSYFFWGILLLFGFIWVTMLGARLWDLVSYIRENGLNSQATKELAGHFFMGLGLVLLWLIVALSINLFLKQYLPDWSLFHGTDDDGEPTDLRETITVFIAFAVTYLLIRGFRAWKKDKSGF
jgi:hypothetical protein